MGKLITRVKPIIIKGYQKYPIVSPKWTFKRIKDTHLSALLGINTLIDKGDNILDGLGKLPDALKEQMSDPLLKKISDAYLSSANSDVKLLKPEIKKLIALRNQFEKAFTNLRKNRSKTTLVKYRDISIKLKKQSEKVFSLLSIALSTSMEKRALLIRSFKTGMLILEHITSAENSKTLGFSSPQDIKNLEKLRKMTNFHMNRIAYFLKFANIKSLFIIKDSEMQTNPQFISTKKQGKRKTALKIVQNFTEFEDYTHFAPLPPFLLAEIGKNKKIILGENYIDLTKMNNEQINKATWILISNIADKKVLEYGLLHKNRALVKLSLGVMCKEWETKKSASRKFTKDGITRIIRGNEKYKEAVDKNFKTLYIAYRNVDKFMEDLSHPEIKAKYIKFFNEDWKLPDKIFFDFVSGKTSEPTFKSSFLDWYKYYFMKYKVGDAIALFASAFPLGQGITSSWFFSQGFVGYKVADATGDTAGKISSGLLMATFALGPLAKGLGKIANIVEEGSRLSLAINYARAATQMVHVGTGMFFTTSMAVDTISNAQKYIEIGNVKYLFDSLSSLIMILSAAKGFKESNVDRKGSIKERVKKVIIRRAKSNETINKEDTHGKIDEDRDTTKKVVIKKATPKTKEKPQVEEDTSQNARIIDPDEIREAMKKHGIKNDLFDPDKSNRTINKEDTHGKIDEGRNNDKGITKKVVIKEATQKRKIKFEEDKSQYARVIDPKEIEMAKKQMKKRNKENNDLGRGKHEEDTTKQETMEISEEDLLKMRIKSNERELEIYDDIKKMSSLPEKDILHVTDHLYKIEKQTGAKFDIKKLVSRGILEGMAKAIKTNREIVRPKVILKIGDINAHICPIIAPEGSHRRFVFSYIVRDKKIHVALYYKSGSSISWRLLPLNEGDYYFKSFKGEEHINADWRVQKYLDSIKPNKYIEGYYRSIDKLASSVEKKEINDPNVWEKRREMDNTIFVQGNNNLNTKEIPILDTKEEENWPDFKRPPLSVWEAESPIYGDIYKVAVKSQNGKFIYVFTVPKDPKQIAFISSVQTANGNLSNYGLPLAPNIKDPMGDILSVMTPYEYPKAAVTFVKKLKTPKNGFEKEVGWFKKEKIKFDPNKRDKIKALDDEVKNRAKLGETNGKYIYFGDIIAKYVPFLKKIQGPLREIIRKTEEEHTQKLPYNFKPKGRTTKGSGR